MARSPGIVLALLLSVGCEPDKGGGDGNTAPPINTLDEDGDGLKAAEDCDDHDASVGGPHQWWYDWDGDGYGDASDVYETEECDAPDNHVDNSEDCDDRDALVSPGGTEVCDELDNDCNGAVDDDPVDIGTWYDDADGDGYGEAGTGQEACEAPTDTVDNEGDCDDGDASVNPEAEESCNWTDDDCDGAVDQGMDTSTWYLDEDGDGYGVDDDPLDACGPPDDTWVADGGDCDDTGDAVSPGAEETCDGIDDDCDGAIDEDGAVDAPTWYDDADSDGYGDPATAAAACDQPTGTVSNDEDCDDEDRTINPDGTEACDAADNDCDGTVDEDDATDAPTWYVDTDADGYGDAAGAQAACDQPTGYSDNADDCDDTDDEVLPGGHEICADGVDSDCDGADATCGAQSLEDAGLVLLGGAAGDQAGAAVAGGSDLTGDGQIDVVVTARYQDGAAADAGALYVVSGAERGSVSLSTATATILGEAASDYLGDHVTLTGDVDGDGYPDVLVGAQYSDSGGSASGEAYLFSGPLSGSLSASTADAALTGEVAGDYAGVVAGLGDIDADGYRDILVGAVGADSAATDAGVAYIVLGPLTGDLDLSLANAELQGESVDDRAPGSAAGAGDVDGDGNDDIVVGSQYDDDGGADAGAAWIVRGPVKRSKSLANADAKLLGESADDRAGRLVRGAGDVDGDGYDDVIVGAPQQSDGGALAGAAYVVYGPISGSASLSTAGATLVGEDAGDQVGVSVAGAGDVDGDGNDDVIVGATGEGSAAAGAGAAYLVRGPLSGLVELHQADAKLQGLAAGDVAGGAVTGTGDLDGDGLDDVMVGAVGNDTAGTAAGAAYVVFGSSF